MYLFNLLEELRDKPPDRTERQNLVENGKRIEGASGEVDNSDESSTEAC